MKLFEPASIGALSLSNRVVMAPLTRTRAGEHGVPNDLLVEHYRQRAGLGMIITEGTWPVQEGRSYPGQPGIETEDQIAGWRRVTDAAGRVSTPPGTSGIETRLALLYTEGVRTGRLSPERWVDACCTRPADVFGLRGKGRLRPGHDADIVVFDPERRVTLEPGVLHSAIDHSTYEGTTVTGFPRTTIARGEVLVHDGELAADPGRGRLLREVTGSA